LFFCSHFQPLVWIKFFYFSLQEIVLLKVQILKLNNRGMGADFLARKKLKIFFQLLCFVPSKK